AEVFKAKSFGSDGFEKIVAIKRILPNIAEDEEFITMFIDEAKISVQLNHPNIAQITDLNKVDDIYYIAMEYVNGKDIRTIFERCRSDRTPMSIAQACFLVMKVCEGLEYAHNKKDANGHEIGIVHRDISPQNILISYEGDVKIIDFGIAKAAGKASKTQAGILKGKFGYMSPEQVRGLPLDKRSDIFSLGIVLYELLTGERLFVGESDFSTLEKVRNVEILPPSTYNRKIPELLEIIVLRALAKEVEDRYQSSGDFHDELQAFMYNCGEFYSRKDLAAWMKKTFSDEVAEEQVKLEQYAKIQMPPELRSQQPGMSPGNIFDGPTLQPAVNSGPARSHGKGDDWWEDDEIETALYDKPGDVTPKADPLLAPRAPSFTDAPSHDEPLFSFGSTTPVSEPPREMDRMNSFESMPMMDSIPQMSGPLPSPLETPKQGGKGVVIAATVGFCLVLAAFLVWFFVFRGGKPESGVLIVNTTPSEGSVVKVFDSAQKPVKLNKSVPLRVELPAGQYLIVVEHKGYSTVKQMVSLEANHTREVPILLEKLKESLSTFKLSISGAPKGATVWLDGKEMAEKTPWTGMDLKPGTYKVKIGFGNQFHEFEKSYTKNAGELLNLKYSLVPKKVTVTMNVFTPKARVCIVNDINAVPKRAQCNVDPKNPYDLSPVVGREYYLKVTRAGFNSYLEKMDFDGKTVWSPKAGIRLLKPGATVDISPPIMNTVTVGPMEMTMTPIMVVVNTMPHPMPMIVTPPAMPSGGTGTLRIGSKPRALVYVDGAKKGWTPRRITLSSGRHRITLINNELGKRNSFTVNIGPGKTVTKVVTF
ncbi:protein kinase, partial [Myxococcota bacterium]|nr:protein kinase [Myxococcota bacterium]